MDTSGPFQSSEINYFGEKLRLGCLSSANASRLIRRGFFVRGRMGGMDEAEAKLWEQAVRRGLPWFRFLRRPLTPEAVEKAENLAGGRLEPAWLALKARIQAGDEMWPFEFDRYTLGMRRGYVVLRRGKPIGGLVIEVS